MSNFKIGTAKTLGGYDAFIFEIGDTIFGKVKDANGHWFSCQWKLDGTGQMAGAYQLYPNTEPLREEIILPIGTEVIKLGPEWIGKKARLTIVEIRECLTLKDG